MIVGVSRSGMPLDSALRSLLTIRIIIIVQGNCCKRCSCECTTWAGVVQQSIHQTLHSVGCWILCWNIRTWEPRWKQWSEPPSRGADRSWSFGEDAFEVVTRGEEHILVRVWLYCIQLPSHRLIFFMIVCVSYWLVSVLLFSCSTRMNSKLYKPSTCVKHNSQA